MDGALFDHLKREHLTPDLQLVWDCAGEEVVKSLLQNVSGIRLYIPLPKALPEFMSAVIHDLNKTLTVREIALTLNVSDRFVEMHLSGQGKVTSIPKR